MAMSMSNLFAIAIMIIRFSKLFHLNVLSASLIRPFRKYGTLPAFGDDFFRKKPVKFAGERTLSFCSKTSSNTSPVASELSPDDVEEHCLTFSLSELSRLFKKSAADLPGLTVSEVLRLDERKPMKDKISFFLAAVN